jgi:alpha-glucosidase
MLAPITRPGREHREVYVPEGTWVHWFTGERIDGPAHVVAHAPLGRPALYARANTPIPLWPALPHTGATPAELTLRIALAPGAAPGSSSLYEDAGDGYAHEDGAYARRTLECDGRQLRIGPREGGWTPPRENVVMEFGGRSVRVAESAGEQVVELE